MWPSATNIDDLLWWTAISTDVCRKEAPLLSCALTSACSTGDAIPVTVRRSLLSALLDAAAATNDVPVRETEEGRPACFGHTASKAASKLQARPRVAVPSWNVIRVSKSVCMSEFPSLVWCTGETKDLQSAVWLYSSLQWKECL